MTGPVPVIRALQESLSAHWTAIETYQTQAEHLRRWGYPKLAERAAADADEERGHAAKLLGRLEFYDQAPTTEHEPPDWPRHDYEGLLASNLELESAAAEIERQGILAARAAGDERTAILLAENLEGSEDSLRDIEAIRRVIRDVSLANYLANQT